MTKLTNNQKLRQLMTKHGLTWQGVADLGFSRYSVKSWLIHPGSEAHRHIKTSTLNKLIEALGEK